MVDYKTNMGNRLKTQRKKLHMTQEQLAEKLNISVKHYGGVERGTAGLSLENLIEVSNIFNVSLDYLIKGIDSPSEDTILFEINQIYQNCPPEKRPYIVELLKLIMKFNSL